MSPHYQPWNEPTPRAREAVALIDSGLSGPETAERMGVSRERVRQLWKRATGTPLPRRHKVRSRACLVCGATYIFNEYRAHVAEAGHAWHSVKPPGSVGRDWTEPMRAYAEGMSSLEVAERFGVKRISLYNALVRNGIPRHLNYTSRRKS